MKYLINTLVYLLVVGSTVTCKNSKTNDTSTHSIFLVRHAEKGDDGTKDPPLTGEGIRRAEQLADMLKYENITKVYSTDFTRTRETAKPVAHRFDLEIEIYDPKDPNFARKLKNEMKDHNILVVGHSNSTPTLVNSILGEEKFTKIDESDYSNLFEMKMKKGKLEASKKTF